jgi:deazaflavin-dependent oxidoreductase (nitroreductase family)
MNLKDKSSVVAQLTTVGRKSGEPRTVELRFLFFNGNFYATSTRVKGKHWCQNMLKNPAVEMSVQSEKIFCTAKQVTDDNFRKQVLTLRDSPPQLERAVFEIVPQR